MQNKANSNTEKKIAEESRDKKWRRALIPTCDHKGNVIGYNETYVLKGISLFSQFKNPDQSQQNSSNLPGTAIKNSKLRRV